MKKIVNKSWGMEIARDVLALGSWIFYILVVARALIGPYWEFVYQLLIAGILILLGDIFIKNYDGYLARGLALVVFTILFYNDDIYLIFVIIIYLLMILSSVYLSGKIKKTLIGLGVGVISVVVGYFLERLIG